MPDESIVLQVDERPAVAATGRANLALKKTETVTTEMGAKMVSTFESVGRGALRVAEAAGGVAVAFGAVRTAAAGATGAVVAHGVATQSLVNTYRTLRLALSPTLFTAATLAIGVAVEETIRLFNARARLIEQDALMASQQNRGFQATSAYSSAERIGNYGAGALNRSTANQYSPAKLYGIVGDFRDLTDPIDRADLAVQKFGKDAEKMLPLLDDNLKRTIERSLELAQALDGPTRESLQRMRDTLQEPGRMLRSFGDDFRYLAEKSKQDLVVTVTVIERHIRSATPPSTSVPGGRTESFEPGMGLNSGGPVPDEVPSLLEIIESAREGGMYSVRPPGLPGYQYGPGLDRSGASPGTIRTASGVAGAYSRSLAAVSGQLGSARARVATLTDQFQRAGGNQGLVAGPLLQAQREVQLLEPRVNRLEEIAQGVQKTIAYINSITEADKAATTKQFEGATLLSQGPKFAKGSTVTYDDSFAGLIEKLKFQSAGQGFAYAGTIQMLRSRGVGINGIRGGPSDASDLFANQQELDTAGRRSIDRELSARERIVQLQAGPGGERETAQKIYELRVAAADKEREILQVSKEYLPYREKLDQARLDRTIEMVSIDRQQFNSVRSTSAGLFNTLFTQPRSFGRQLGSTLQGAVLKPITEGLGGLAARTLTPLIFGADGTGGIAGGLKGLFGGGSQDPVKATDLNTQATMENTAAVRSLSSQLSIGMAAMSSSPLTLLGGGKSGGFRGLLSALKSGGAGFRGLWTPRGTSTDSALSGNFGFSQLASRAGFFNAGDISLGAGKMTTAAGIGGAGGALAGFATSPMGLAAGMLLAQQSLLGSWGGTWKGIAGGAGGGALIGAALGTMVFPGIGTALGAAIGAAAGFLSGVGEMLAGMEPKWKQAERLIQEQYHVSINRGMGEQIAALAQQKYGGRVSMAVQDPDIRRMIELYAAATGQRMALSASTPRAGSLVEQSGRLFQSPGFQFGRPYTFESSLPVAGSYSTSTYPSARTSAPEMVSSATGSVAEIIDQHVTPSYVQGKFAAAQQASSGRVKNAALFAQPGLITG